MHSIWTCNDRASQQARAKHAQVALCWTLTVTHSSGEGCWIQHLRERASEGALRLLLWLVQLLCNLQLPWSRHALQLKRSYAAWVTALMPLHGGLKVHHSKSRTQDGKT